MLHSKWAMLAKAYSTIRDTHKGEVTLEGFLRETVPIIEAIPASEYLATVGYSIRTTGGGEVILVRTQQGPVRLAENFLTTNLSADDIVQHCYTVGYVTMPHGGVKPVNRTRHVRMSMAVAAQPSHRNDNYNGTDENGTQGKSEARDAVNEVCRLGLHKR